MIQRKNCIGLLIGIFLCLAGINGITQELEFREAGPFDVSPGQITVIQAEDGTPGAEPLEGFDLILEPTLKSGVIVKALVDGRDFPEFPLSHEIHYTINVTESGTYYLFAHVNAFDGGSDSFFVGVDGEIANSDDYRFNIGTRDEYDVAWVTSDTLEAVVPFELSAGEHVINWHAREPDAEVDFIGVTDKPDLDLSQVEQPGPFPNIILGRRSFSQILLNAGGSINVSVTLTNTKDESISTTVTENLPPQWTAENISNDGTFSNGTITWDVTVDPAGTLELTYTAVSSESSSGESPEFSGVTSSNLGDIKIEGESKVFVSESVGIFEGHADIGEVDVEGSATFSDGIYEVLGGGADIWGTADEFHFAYTEMSRSFSIQAQILTLPFESGSNWVKSALMVRNDLSPESIHYDTLVRTDLQVDSQWRLQPGEDSQSTSSRLLPLEAQDGRLRIVRVGDLFQTWYFNIQDSEWQLYDSRTIEMEAPVFVGLAVTSHEEGSLSIGEFSNVEIEEFSLTAQRSFSTTTPRQGETITATIEVNAMDSMDVSLTESAPDGWGISDATASTGEVDIAGGGLDWTASGLEGIATLSYKVTIPVDAPQGDFMFEGEISGNGETHIIYGPKITLPFLVDPDEYSPFQFEEGVAFSEAEDLYFVNNDEAAGGPYLAVEDDPSLNSSGSYVNSVEGNNDVILPGFLLFPFEVNEPGEYAFMASTHTPSGGDDSWYIAVDSDPEPITGPYRWQGSDNYTTDFETAWVAVDDEGPASRQTWTFDEGFHFLKIHPREDGSMVDWVAVTFRTDLEPETFDPYNIPPLPTSVDDYMLY